MRTIVLALVALALGALLVDHYNQRVFRSREAFNAAASESKRKAVLRHPELAKKGSGLNLFFLTRYQEWKTRGDVRLDRTDWPEVLMADCLDSPDAAYVAARRAR